MLIQQAEIKQYNPKRQKHNSTNSRKQHKTAAENSSRRQSPKITPKSRCSSCLNQWSKHGSVQPGAVTRLIFLGRRRNDSGTGRLIGAHFRTQMWTKTGAQPQRPWRLFSQCHSPHRHQPQRRWVELSPENTCSVLLYGVGDFAVQSAWMSTPEFSYRQVAGEKMDRLSCYIK